MVIVDSMHWMRGVLEHLTRNVWGPETVAKTLKRHNTLGTSSRASEDRVYERRDAYDAIQTMQEIHTIVSNAEETDIPYSEHIQVLNYLPLFIKPFLSDEEDEEDPTLRENDAAAEADSDTLGVAPQGDPPGIEPHAKPLINKGVLVLIRSVIKNVMLPAWVPRPPLNLGDAAHGNLKVA
ncbi:MAG: hypothetical protein CYPHOPRED_003700, partial [Cyphobasidiales sp. Tagirdzhanova-0007]